MAFKKSHKGYLVFQPFCKVSDHGISENTNADKDFILGHANSMCPRVRLVLLVFFS